MERDEKEKKYGWVSQWVYRKLKSAFEGIVVQRERRWRSLATCHLDRR